MTDEKALELPWLCESRQLPIGNCGGAIRSALAVGTETGAGDLMLQCCWSWDRRPRGEEDRKGEANPGKILLSEELNTDCFIDGGEAEQDDVESKLDRGFC